jgi:hypothetical protein
MFGFYTRIQFSVFKSKILRVPQLKILFGYCFPFLYSNSITVFLILKSSLLRTTFGCFLFQYLFSFNKIIIFFLFISSAPITIIGILSLSPPFLFLGGFSDARGGVAVVEVESRWSQWSRVKIWTADLETCGGLFRGGFVNLLWVLSGVWLAVGRGGLRWVISRW